VKALPGLPASAFNLTSLFVQPDWLVPSSMTALGEAEASVPVLNADEKLSINDSKIAVKNFDLPLIRILDDKMSHSP
jgi:hypothetical protein